jgi:2-dehydro-3-deoxyglucarate aldolase
MTNTKEKLKASLPAVGGWIMIGHPTIAELMAGEALDWIGVDMEHAATDLPMLENICRAVKGSGMDLFVRLSSCDEVLAKRVLDIGANGIIVPNVNSAAQAEQAVKIAKYPPDGIRGASLARCTDFGRNFKEYTKAHNDSVFVAVMLEHIDAIRKVDSILSTAGIDAAFIGPYDLSASMGLSGQIQHPDVLFAQQQILDACKKHHVPAGIHVVSLEPSEVQRRIEQGFRFIGLSLDTEFIIQGVRAMLGGAR